MSDNEDNFDDGDFDDAEEDEGLDDLENAEDDDQENVQILPAGEGQQANQKRITTPYMTKYERARVLGTRALQIAQKWPSGSPEVQRSNKWAVFAVGIHGHGNRFRLTHTEMEAVKLRKDQDLASMRAESRRQQRDYRIETLTVL
uniref:RNA polymerase II subunit F n=1 Tax=Stegastes partitus TaxID=144197 RepID=A0A3B5AXD9_9TELE